jgi:hypothetical protein
VDLAPHLASTSGRARRGKLPGHMQVQATERYESGALIGASYVPW